MNIAFCLSSSRFYDFFWVNRFRKFTFTLFSWKHHFTKEVTYLVDLTKYFLGESFFIWAQHCATHQFHEFFVQSLFLLNSFLTPKNLVLSSYPNKSIMVVKWMKSNFCIFIEICNYRSIKKNWVKIGRKMAKLISIST